MPTAAHATHPSAGAWAVGDRASQAEAAEIFDHHMPLAFGVAKRRRQERALGYSLWKSTLAIG